MLVDIAMMDGVVKLSRWGIFVNSRFVIRVWSFTAVGLKMAVFCVGPTLSNEYLYASCGMLCCRLWRSVSLFCVEIRLRLQHGLNTMRMRRSGRRITPPEGIYSLQSYSLSRQRMTLRHMFVTCAGPSPWKRALTSTAVRTRNTSMWLPSTRRMTALGLCWTLRRSWKIGWRLFSPFSMGRTL